MIWPVTVDRLQRSDPESPVPSRERLRQGARQDRGILDRLGEEVWLVGRDNSRSTPWSGSVHPGWSRPQSSSRFRGLVAPTQPRIGECRRRGEVVVVRVELRARRDDLVDAVQDVVTEHDVGSGEEVVKLLRRPRPDDDRGDGRMSSDEGVRQMGQWQSSLRGELCQRTDSLQLGSVGGDVQVDPLLSGP